MQDSSTKPHWIQRHPRLTLLMVNIFVLVVMDVGLCLSLRVLGVYQPHQKSDTVYRMRHDRYHHSLRPNMSYDSAQWGKEAYHVRTNSLGFKDAVVREIPLQSEQHRILIIGDSFVEGIGYPYEKTFFGRLSGSYDGAPIEFLNAGVSSYSPIIYHKKIATLIQAGLKFNRLIVFIDISDPVDEAQHYLHGENGDVISPEEKRSLYQVKKWLKDFRSLLVSCSIILSELRNYQRSSKTKVRYGEPSWRDSLNQERSKWTFDIELYQSVARRGLEKAALHMGMLHRLMKDEGIPLSVAVYPWPDQVANKEIDSRQVTFWNNWCAENEVDFINFFPLFIDESDPRETVERYFILGDVHWNEQGHKLIAQGLKRYLSTKGYDFEPDSVTS